MALLWAVDSLRRSVHQELIPLDAYYDGEHIFDSPERLKAAKIRRLRALLFDDGGRIYQEWENTYDARGNRVSGWTRHADGTLNED